MENNFSKYSKEELVGRLVLFEYGYYATPSKLITTISKVTKTGFKIRNANDLILDEYIFDFRGNRKGCRGNSYMTSVSNCYLITEEESLNLRKEWTRIREEKELREIITEKIPNASFEQLQKISEILN
jgi:hypothetical protein